MGDALLSGAERARPRQKALALRTAVGLATALLLALVGSTRALPADASDQQSALPSPDAWESDPATLPDPGRCQALGAERIMPVAPAQRAAAVVRLRSAAIVPLDAPTAAALAPAARGAAERGGLKPFLVRAVAKSENGAFTVRLCGTRLWVMHGSIGRVVPPSIRAPLVVLLARQSRDVRVSWSMAQ
jgi:hypothetical protein